MDNENVLEQINTASDLLRKVIEAQKTAVDNGDAYREEDKDKPHPHLALSREYDALPEPLKTASHSVVYDNAKAEDLVGVVVDSLAKMEEAKNAE